MSGNPSTVALQLTAAAATGIYNSTIAGTGPLTLAGSLVTGTVATLAPARRIEIQSSGSDTANVFTIVGTDRYGNVQTETMTGVTSGTPQTSVYDYLTITSISASATSANTIEIGTNTTASSPWIIDNLFSPFWALSIAVSITGSGTTPTFTVEHTYDDPNKIAPSLGLTPQQWSIQPSGYTPPTLWSLTALNGKSANTEAQYVDQPIFAHRLTVTAGTKEVVMQSTQAGIGSP